MPYEDFSLDNPIIWLGGAVAGLVFLTLLRSTAKTPAISLAALYALYTFSSTLFRFEDSIRGVFYPLYLIVGVGAVIAAIRLRGRSGLLPSGTAALFFVFSIVLLLGVMQMEAELTFLMAQRIFTYGAGIMAMAIFWASPFDIAFRRTLIFSSTALAAWVIDTASTKAFGYRAGMAVNPNYVAMLIAFGAVPLTVSFFTNTGVASPKQWIGRSAALLVNLYALMLLASRGIAAGLLAAVAICILSTKRSGRQITTALVVFALLGWVLLALPGTTGLWDRVSDQSDDSMNSRLPLWEAAISEMGDFTPIELLFGRGLGSSEAVATKAVTALASLHNAYLQTLFEYGLIGCGCFLGIHGICVGLLWRRRNQDGLEGLALVVLLMTMNLSASNTENVLYWLVLGFAVSGGRIAELQRTRPLSSLHAMALPFVPVRARSY